MESFSGKYDTFIIAYCPDNDSYFITNERMFFYEFDMKFNSEKDALEFFENHVFEFIAIRNQIRLDCGQKTSKHIYMLNNKKFYSIEQPANTSTSTETF